MFFTKNKRIPTKATEISVPTYSLCPPLCDCVLFLPATSYHPLQIHNKPTKIKSGNLSLVVTLACFVKWFSTKIKKKESNAGNIHLQQTTQTTAVPGLLVDVGPALKPAIISCSVPRGRPTPSQPSQRPWSATPTYSLSWFRLLMWGLMVVSGWVPGLTLLPQTII